MRKYQIIKFTASILTCFMLSVSVLSICKKDFGDDQGMIYYYETIKI